MRILMDHDGKSSLVRLYIYKGTEVLKMIILVVVVASHLRVADAQNVSTVSLTVYVVLAQIITFQL